MHPPAPIYENKGSFATGGWVPYLEKGNKFGVGGVAFCKYCSTRLFDRALYFGGSFT